MRASERRERQAIKEEVRQFLSDKGMVFGRDYDADHLRWNGPLIHRVRQGFRALAAEQQERQQQQQQAVAQITPTSAMAMQTSPMNAANPLPTSTLTHQDGTSSALGLAPLLPHPHFPPPPSPPPPPPPFPTGQASTDPTPEEIEEYWRAQTTGLTK